MNKNIEDIITDLLSGYKLNPDEQFRFDEWMEREENRKKFYRLQHIQSAIYAVHAAKNADSKVEWEKWSFRLTPRKRILRYLPYAATAMLVLGLGISFGILNYRQKATVIPVSQQTIPGPKQAILTLSTGQQIVLSDSLSPMTEQNGTHIQYTGQQLVYSPTDTTTTIVYNTITVPRGGEYKLTLSDGSTVWINSESEITYPVAFKQDHREIQLKGEAFFDIHKDHLRPFIVHTEEFNIRVTGTQFNIRTYPDDIASATLTQGSIQLENKNTITRLLPGQQASLIHGQIEVKDVDIEEAVGWRYEVFSFRQRPLESLLNEIARWYDLEIFYQNDHLRNLHFTAWFRRSSTIHELIEILEKTQQIKFDLKGKTLTVKNHH